MKNTAISAREHIIEALLEYPGIGLKQLQQLVQQRASRKYSYHAIYKSIRSLMDDKVVTRTSHAYSLSPTWIEQKISFADRLRSHMLDQNGALVSHDAHALEFKDILELNRFLRTLEDQHLPLFASAEKSSVIWVVYHCYNYLLQPAEELSYIKKLKEHNVDFRVLCYGDSTLDKWTRRTFKRFGAHMKTGAGVGGISGMNIYDDMAIMIYYGTQFLEVLNDIYSKTDSISDLCLGELFDKLNSIDYRIHAVIYRKPSIVAAIKERALAFFP
ncbi:MAG: hypothetical protein ACOCWQ_05035 [Nanoarchaeota archaeon]